LFTPTIAASLERLLNTIGSTRNLSTNNHNLDSL